MRGRRVGAAAVTVGLAALSLSVLGAGPAEAAYVVQGVAMAQGVHVTVTADSAPLFPTPVDASEPLAAAAVDARGGSTAQAAYPYPGDTAYYGVTGVVAPDLPAGVAIPTLPGNEVSSFPATPSAKLDAAAYQLDAESQAETSTAIASSGVNAQMVAGGTNEAMATVTAVPDTGRVTAAARSSAAGLVMGPLVLGQISSHVTMTRTPGGQPTRNVGIDIGQTTVLGQTVDISPAGMTLPTSTTVALPDISAILGALTQAGITVTYLTEIDTPDGTVAAGVKVSQDYTDTTTGQRTHTTYDFGQAAASVTSGGRADVTSIPLVTPTSPSASAPASATPVASAPASATSVAAPAVPGPSIVTPVTDTTGAVTAPPVIAPPGTAAPTALVAERRAGDESLTASGASFYLVLVGAAIAVMACSSTIRALGVRLLWTR